MSDILTITRGRSYGNIARGLSGYGCIIRGVGDPGSPLRSILSTPGLVACYLPYMDVYGRNVLPVGSEAFDIGLFSTNVSISKAGPDADGWYTVTITYVGDSDPRHWRWVYKTNIQAGVPCPGAVEAQLVSGTCDFGSDMVAANRVAINSTPQLLVTPNVLGANRTGNGYLYMGFYNPSNGCVIKVRKPQINYGSLHPYTPPAGLSQILTDFSGRGNHAQLGSTTGADTNDPTWGSKYLDFNGIDQYFTGAPEAVTTWSLLGDPQGNALGWVQGKRTNVAGRLYAELRFNRVPTEAERVRLFHNVQTLLAGQGVTGTFYDWAYPIPTTAGVMYFSLKNGTDRLWVAPDGTTSTAERPQFDLASNGTTWAYLSNWDATNLEISDYITDTRYVGDIADIPPVINYYLDFYNCYNVTGDITNIRPSYHADFTNCSKVTGDITNIRPSYFASFYNCYNVTGDITNIQPSYSANFFRCSKVTGDITNIRPSYRANFQNCYNVTGDITNIQPSYYADFRNCSNVTGTLNPQATLSYIDLQGTGLNTTQLDNSIIAVANVTTVVGTFYWSTGVRSTASDAAYDSLSAKGWTLTAREW